MTTLKDLTKSRILGMLKQVSPVGRWKVLVVDPSSLLLLNACCKMSEILSENVTVVESVLKKRMPNDMEAIYFISSNLESMDC